MYWFSFDIAYIVLYNLIKVGDCLYKRKKYLEKISPFIHTDIIKIITGMRRSGKSVLLSQIKEKIIEAGVSENFIIEINLESMKFEELCNKNRLYEYIISLATSNTEKYYILLDEIQLVDGFERAINSLRVDIKSSIFITGSNANLLSGEMATLLSGRYVKFDIQPFTYKEYCEYLDMNLYDERNFIEYMMFGGLPQTFMFEETQGKQALLTDILDSIIYRDILHRANSKDVDMVKKLIHFILSQTGNIISTKNLVNHLNRLNKTVKSDTILYYLDLMVNSRIINKCSRYDLKGKKILKRDEKYYVTDLGLLNHTKNLDKIDKGACLETIVYNQLMNFGYTINIGKVSEYEVDFVATKGDDIRYFQVSYHLNSEEVINREYRSLELIKDNYPKYLISFDQDGISRNGIKFINILDFLSMDSMVM